ncbi:MAG: hypothetical protein IJP05_07320, partial [Oscillospiraceae bacterium]|nr:hypothetical protein [Oscillospiraceae bacterium]
ALFGLVGGILTDGLGGVGFSFSPILYTVIGVLFALHRCFNLLGGGGVCEAGGGGITGNPEGNTPLVKGKRPRSGEGIR